MKIKIFLFVFFFLFLAPLSVGLTGDGAHYTQAVSAWAGFSELRENAVEKEEPEIFLSEPLSLSLAPTVSQYKIDGVKGICQYPYFPSGCESVSAVMLLRYLGVDITVGTFVDKHLETSDQFYHWGGRFYGPDPYEVFAGSPRTTYFGCMAPVIQKAMASAAGEGVRVSLISGLSLEEICQRYIARDMPVLLWVTRDMLSVSYDVHWYLPSGEKYKWPAGEHCMVLVGFDEKYYHLMDPETGTCRKFSKSRVEKRYEDLGMQAVAAKAIL